MPLTPWACAHFGFWQKHLAPTACPVYEDMRNDLPADGLHFLPEAKVAARSTGRWRELYGKLVAFRMSPSLGLDGTGWLLLHPDGNTAFERDFLCRRAA